MYINNELFEKKYQEMILSNLTEDYLDIKAFGELKMFIGIKPSIVLVSIQLDIVL